MILFSRLIRSGDSLYLVFSDNVSQRLCNGNAMSSGSAQSKSSRQRLSDEEHQWPVVRLPVNSTQSGIACWLVVGCILAGWLGRSVFFQATDDHSSFGLQKETAPYHSLPLLRCQRPLRPSTQINGSAKPLRQQRLSWAGSINSSSGSNSSKRNAASLRPRELGAELTTERVVPVAADSVCFVAAAVTALTVACNVGGGGGGGGIEAAEQQDTATRTTTNRQRTAGAYSRGGSVLSAKSRVAAAAAAQRRTYRGVGRSLSVATGRRNGGHRAKKQSNTDRRIATAIDT